MIAHHFFFLWTDIKARRKGCRAGWQFYPQNSTFWRTVPGWKNSRPLHCPPPSPMVREPSAPTPPFTNRGDAGLPPSCRGPPALPAGRVAERSDDEVVEEMTEAREIGIRQSPLPCRYCMAVPMSSSISLATCCSVARKVLPPLSSSPLPSPLLLVPFPFPLLCKVDSDFSTVAIEQMTLIEKLMISSQKKRRVNGGILSNSRRWLTL